MNKGFTLTELLATITILSILIVITIPAYNRISKSVKESDLENTKNYLKTTMLNYANKYLIDEIKPLYNKCDNNSCCQNYSIQYMIDNDIFTISNSNQNVKNIVTNEKLNGYIKICYNVEKYELTSLYCENNSCS